MDVWIVAAAAGAGYAVQHLKNFTRGKNKWLDLSPENLNIVKPESSSIRQKVEDKSCPFRRVLSRKKFGEEMSRETVKFCEAVSDSEIASTSGYEDENLVKLDNFASSSTVSNSNSIAALNNEDVQGDWEGRLPSDSNEVFTSDSLPHPSSSEIGLSYSFRRKRRSRNRRINCQFRKPRTSLESCLMAQLYEEHAEIEEYTYYLHPLQKPTVRPFLVTDGSRIISTAPHESFSEPTGTGPGECQLRKDAYSQENKTVCGVPRLSNVVPVELQKKAKTRNRKDQVLRGIDSSKIAHGNHDNAQGTSDMALLFYLGLTMGIISSFLANKQEVEKLKNLLKQTENLVQDLQEELEMKDSLTVKELAAEDYESQDVHNDRCFDDAVYSLSLEQNFNEEYCGQKAEEKSLSKIEEELEAELQRLESNMNSSSLEGKLCSLTEFDPDLVSDVHEDTLRVDLFGANTFNQLYADRDGSCSSTPRSVHYPVSPRELSLRLHQVIQSRLEERVKELETALQNSQRKVKCMESEHVHPWRVLSNYKTGTSSTQDSPIARDGQESVDQPVIINLSGEALAAYNEAYEEFTKVSVSDEEDLQIGFENGYHVQNGIMDRHSASNGNQETVLDRRIEEDLYTLSNDIICSSRDEIEDGEDETERLLIRQIVEKAKQGSPAILKAQRALLLSTDENEH